MMQNKGCILLLAFSLIIGQAISLDLYSRKDKNNEDDIDDNSVVSTGIYNQLNDDKPQPPTNRRDRYQPYTSSSNNYRSRSRWSSPPASSSSSSSSYNDRSHSDDRFPYDYGTLQPGGYDNSAYVSNGPSCYSLLDPIYPIFSDICGSVPQARYSLPNAFGHVERWQIAQVLSVLLGPATPSSANPVCSRSLRLLLCPLLFPPCARRYEAPPVLPCQPFCRAIKSQCASPSLELLPCDLLPFTSDLCPINPTPFSSLLASFGPSSPFNGPAPPMGFPPMGFPPMGFPPSALQSLLAQSAFPGGFSPMDMPPPAAFPSMFPPSAGLSPMDMPPGVFSPFSPSPPFPQMFPPSPFAPGMGPPGVPPPGFPSFLPGSGMPPPPFPSFLPPPPMMPPGFPPPGFASFLAASGMPPPPPPMNPFFNGDPYMADSLTPILVDFPPLQYGQNFQQAPRFFPFTRSATEKV